MQPAGFVDAAALMVEGLLFEAGRFRKGKTKIGEYTIKGNIDDVFNTIIERGEVL